MRLPQFFVATFVLGSLALAADLQRVLSEGQTAMMRGDLDTAKRAFQMAYQIDPRNSVAIGYLRQFAVQEARSGSSSSVEKQLAGVILPQVQFKEATFSSALEALKAKISEVSKGRSAANFVVQPGVDQNLPVTLSLSNIPATEAIRYLAELARAKVDYQKYAIVLRPGGVAAPSTTSAPTGQ